MSKDYCAYLYTKEFPGNEIHEVYDADLKDNARLHRFTNSEGDEYSAIYIGSIEQGSQVRSREAAMIKWWNTDGYRNRALWES